MKKSALHEIDILNDTSRELGHQVVRFPLGPNRYIEVCPCRDNPKLLEVRCVPDTLMVQPLVSNVIRVGIQRSEGP